LVRILKRALRQLTEASLASILLKDMQRVKLLPQVVMCASSVLPTFMLPRACMGIVCQYFLRYQGNAASFSRDLTTHFPCCTQPKDDLKYALLFWEDLTRCVDAIAEPLGAEELAEDMKAASALLHEQQQKLGIFPEWSNLHGDEHERLDKTAQAAACSGRTFLGGGY